MRLVACLSKGQPESGWSVDTAEPCALSFMSVGSDNRIVSAGLKLKYNSIEETPISGRR